MGLLKCFLKILKRAQGDDKRKLEDHKETVSGARGHSLPSTEKHLSSTKASSAVRIAGNYFICIISITVNIELTMGG